ncbi:ERCC4-type nuclease [Methanococcus maripaludis]|uniref:ERCC4-type nuclease n=1 Tax=Methanococcus maripaludis TaxID=39152 RepID=A0A7J9NXB2_METMI|nr:ERCC4 domain-containing protein [Methanococcus maripaludis]MBA2851653.1 ERCC4-type nuclease [Methanococcus maripaludis]
MITVDTREPAHIKEYFSVFIDNAEIKKLDCGDYRVNDILIERKTLADFNSSCKSKRFFDQAYRLVNEAVENDMTIVYALTNITEPQEHALDTKLMSSVIASAQKRFGFQFIPFFSDEDFINYVTKLDTLPKSKPKVNPMYCLQPLLGNIADVESVEVTVKCRNRARKQKVYDKENITVNYVKASTI